jgi:hypothetical protein
VLLLDRDVMFNMVMQDFKALEDFWVIVNFFEDAMLNLMVLDYS